MNGNDPEDVRQRKIAVAAYHLVESRHFAPGHEVADWLTAEAMIKQQTASNVERAPKAAKRSPSPKAVAVEKPTTKISKPRRKRSPATE